MYKLEYFIDKFDKDTKKQVIANEYFVQQIINRLGECTILRAKSGYKYLKGFGQKTSVEPSLHVVQIVNDDLHCIKKEAIENCKYFKKIFNQEQILFTITETGFEVI